MCDGKPEDATAGGAQLAEVQGEAALEDDDGDGEPDHKPQPTAEGAGGLQDLQHRADQEPEGEEEHDGRHAQSTGEPTPPTAMQRTAVAMT